MCEERGKRGPFGERQVLISSYLVQKLDSLLAAGIVVAAFTAIVAAVVNLVNGGSKKSNSSKSITLKDKAKKSFPKLPKSLLLTVLPLAAFLGLEEGFVVRTLFTVRLFLAFGEAQIRLALRAIPKLGKWVKKASLPPFS